MLIVEFDGPPSWSLDMIRAKLGRVQNTRGLELPRAGGSVRVGLCRDSAPLCRDSAPLYRASASHNSVYQHEKVDEKLLIPKYALKSPKRGYVGWAESFFDCLKRERDICV